MTTEDIKVTFDTGVMIHDRNRNSSKLRDAISGLKGLDIKWSSVTPREDAQQESLVSDEDTIVETTVWDETPWGKGLWGEKTANNNFESILKIISTGSFPAKGKRDNLTDGQRRQLRDAMILATHIREQRDIFVTTDSKAFVGKGNVRRDLLQATFDCKIMTYDEFLAHVLNQQH